MTRASGPLTVSRVGGGQVGGGAAVDDGVRSQVREPGQGHHEAGGVCSGKTHPNAAASPAHGPSSPAPRERGGGGAGPGATTTKPQSRNQTRGCGTPGRRWAPGCGPLERQPAGSNGQWAPWHSPALEARYWAWPSSRALTALRAAWALLTR